MHIAIFVFVVILGGIAIGFLFGYAKGFQGGSRFSAGPKRPVAAWLLFGMGCVFLLVSLGSSLCTWNFAGSATSTTGTIIEMKEKKDKDSDCPTYAPVFSYRDASGSIQIVSSSFFSNPPQFRTGQLVPVLYREGDQTSGRINTFWQMWGLPTIMGIVGSVEMSVGLVKLYWRRRKNRIAALAQV